MAASPKLDSWDHDIGFTGCYYFPTSDWDKLTIDRLIRLKSDKIRQCFTAITGRNLQFIDVPIVSITIPDEIEQPISKKDFKVKNQFHSKIKHEKENDQDERKENEIS